MNKQALRRNYKQQRQAMLPQQRQAIEQALIAHWFSWPQVRLAKNIGSYLATSHECPTMGLHQLCWQQHQRVFVPVLSQSEPGLIELKQQSLLQPTTLPGVFEPESGERVNLASLDFLLIPLLAIDQQGYRLGFGSGYYDRLLAKTNGGPVKRIGLGYAWQMTELLPHDPWDIALDGFLSEEGWLFFS